MRELVATGRDRARRDSAADRGGESMLTLPREALGCGPHRGCGPAGRRGDRRGKGCRAVAPVAGSRPCCSWAWPDTRAPTTTRVDRNETR